MFTFCSSCCTSHSLFLLPSTEKRLPTSCGLVEPAQNSAAWWLQVIRVISAVFLSQTLEAASSDAEMMIQDRLTKKAKFVQKLEGRICRQ